MSHRCGVLGYIPRSNIPPKICSPMAFVENITRFKMRHPACFYTDGNDTYGLTSVTIPNPEPVCNKDAVLKNGWPNTFVLNNLIFFTGLRIALRKGWSHFIYLEADCRVGCDNWDEQLFDFHFSHPEPLVASGTAVAFNVCSTGPAAHLRWRQWVNDQKAIPGHEGLKAPVYGWRGQAPLDDTTPMSEKPTVFVNGALGVYDTVWLAKLFGMDGLPPEQTKDNCKELAETNFAWDFSIGYLLWKALGIHMFDVIQNNPKIYSGFGDIMTTPEERLEMLRQGTVVAVHQIKGAQVL